MNIWQFYAFFRQEPRGLYLPVIIALRSAVAYRGGVLGCSNPPLEIPKALQNRAKLNPICENC